MQDSRAQTLATLDAFLDSQRQLISRTQADIQKLTILREKALKDPVFFVENANNELDDAAFRLSEHETPRMPDNIDWSLYNLYDPARFYKITIPGPLSLSDASKRKPTTSDLQTFVREAAADILGDFKPYVPPPDPDEEDEEDLEAANEQRLAELVNAGRIKQLPKKPAPPRRRVPSGLRLRHEVDTLGIGSRGDLSNNASINSPTDSTPQIRLRPQRIRRPTLRADQAYNRPHSPVTTASNPLRIRIPPIHALPSPLTDPVNDGLSDVTSSDIPVATPPQEEEEEEEEEEESLREDNNSKTRRRSVHSETFNKPWSPTEQRLLEKLLEDIPHGEKNRWSKISKAMSGKRTPRQVASRVQKYFEKLKKFGMDPGT